MLIRESTIDDVTAFSRIRYAVLPWMTASLVAQRNWFTSVPAEARQLRLTAEVDGEVVGFAMGGFNVYTKEEGVSIAAVTVDPRFRGRAIGKALYDPIEDHLRTIGTLRAQGYAHDDPSTIAWAQRQGWTAGAAGRFSLMDPRDLPPMPQTPPGTTVVSVSEVTPEVLYELDLAASADEPGDVSFDGIPFDLWMKRLWHSPDMRHELSTVALVDGVAASFTVVEANMETGRMWSGGTSTLPEYRGHGLAKLIKSVALRKAAEAGITAALTSNDYSNGPMLAINDWLGYKVIASDRSMLKSFS